MMDEIEHERSLQDWEIVTEGEPSLEDYPERAETETHNADGTQKFDAFGAPIKSVVKVREGGLDAKARPPR